MSGEDRKGRILTVAAQLFATRGYSATGVDEVGEALGITGPALYRHFAGKQAVLDEICLAGMRALLDDARRIVAEGREPLDALRGLVEMRVEFAYGTHRHAFAISHAGDTDLSESARRKLLPMEHRYEAEWMRVLAQVRPSAGTDELLVALRAAHSLIGYTAHTEEGRDEADHRGHLAKMALAVLLA